MLGQGPRGFTESVGLPVEDVRAQAPVDHSRLHHRVVHRPQTILVVYVHRTIIATIVMMVSIVIIPSSSSSSSSS
jgi:hypothetical protein